MLANQSCEVNQPKIFVEVNTDKKNKIKQSPKN